jgi:peptide/nickel transport system permease protein
MGGWILGRIGNGASAIVVASVLVFVLLWVGPNPLEQLKRNPEFSPADIERITEQYGLDQPWHQQYASWVRGLARGDWGDSMVTKRPAKEMIMERLPLTLLVTGLAQLLSLAIATPLGIMLAVRRNSGFDHSVAVATFALMATPGFLLALLLQFGALKAYHATGHLVLPTAGPGGEGFLDAVRHLALPVVSLTVMQIAGWSRFLRSEMLTVLASEYVRVARAKGLSSRTIQLRHALPNTALPVITIVAMDVATLFGGAVGTEVIFGLPGMGSLLLTSVNQRDVLVALDIVVIGALLLVVANTVAELLYGVVDPRTRSHS